MGMILYWHKEIAVKTVGPSVRLFLRRLFVVLLLFMYIVDIQQDMRNFFILPCLLVGRNQQKAFNIVNLAAQTRQSCSLTLTVLGFKTYRMTSRKAAKVTRKRVFRLGKHDFPVFRRVRESVCRSAFMILLWQVRQTNQSRFPSHFMLYRQAERR